MDQSTRTFYELRFRTQYLESKATAFQDLFVTVMSKAYPEQFFPCRPWGKVGDRKNDGYLKSEKTLFQVYAPNEMKMSATVAKIEADFREALPHWQNHFDTWVFVHNSAGGLPPDVISKLLQLGREHPNIKVTHWGFDELLLQFRRLQPDAMAFLYGSPPVGSESARVKESKRMLKFAWELMRDEKRREAIEKMKEALVVARTDGDDEEEVEILVALALSVDRLRSGREGGDRQYYFHQAEQKVEKLKSSVAKVIYLRAQAAVLSETHDPVGAENAFRSALEYCQNETGDTATKLAIQGCVIQASFVHFLCAEKRFDEARSILISCEQYARDHREAEDGELLQAALEAGVYLSLELRSDDDAIQRITELEQSASTSRHAVRIGGDLLNFANRASHRNVHKAALASAEAAVRLGMRCIDHSPNFLPGALYTEAMVIFKCGDHDVALRKAEAILDLCNNPDNAAVRHATQHLLAEIKRGLGDSQSAVNLVQSALATVQGGPQDVAFSKLAFARALNDNGQTEAALKQANEAWTLLQSSDIIPKATIDVLYQISDYASQLGADEVVAESIAALRTIPDESESILADKSKVIARTEANSQLREKLLEFVRNDDSGDNTAEKHTSLAAANAEVVRPLLGWWDDMLRGRMENVSEYVAAAYEFWGRGNFSRILHNSRHYPNSFNVTLEVRNLQDVKRAIRLWGLYADFLILLWKGPTKSAWERMLFPLDFDAPGGLGYMIFMGTVLKRKGSRKRWCMGLGYGTALPPEVVRFLATDARPFFQHGRLIIVPAIGTGCFNPGHGVFEQLFAEAANAIPSIQSTGIEGSPLGLIPYSPDAPFRILVDIAHSEAAHLRRLRLLLLKRTRQLNPSGDLGLEAKTLSLEIDDALREFTDRTKAIARKKGLNRAQETLTGTTARFRADGTSISRATDESPFAPLIELQNLGYGWQVDAPQIPRLPKRFQPHDDDMIGGWLAPPRSAWTVPMAKSGETSK